MTNKQKRTKDARRKHAMELLGGPTGTILVDGVPKRVRIAKGSGMIVGVCPGDKTLRLDPLDIEMPVSA